MAPLHVATLTVQRELPKYEMCHNYSIITWLTLSFLSSIISHFSWLAVHALSQSAEACSAPIRLGISKPLGASSVIAEYQTTPRGYSGSAYTSLTPGNRQSSGAGQRETLMRQLHVRAARIGSVPPFKAR